MDTLKFPDMQLTWIDGGAMFAAVPRLIWSKAERVEALINIAHPKCRDELRQKTIEKNLIVEEKKEPVL